MTATDSEPAVVRSDEELVAAFLTAFVGGDAAAIDDLVTADCVLHQVRWPKDTEGRAAVREVTRQQEGTFEDVTVRIEQSVVSGDRIAAQATASARNVGPMRVEDRSVAPTGRAFEVPQFGIYRIEDGRIAEAWVLADALGLVEQLGNLPSGPGAMLSIMFRQLRWRLTGRGRLG